MISLYSVSLPPKAGSGLLWLQPGNLGNVWD